ncbi:MAG: HAMP domain-containing protein [Fulvimarina manganoxydans]|uniref:ATP-binding protein n=1 Tax=Fulvimarina manganoxydans TaxID=937218 RepID=UPI0023551D79|nr:ATP-binding protein [Fulvimarina manganoxydans]MCK5930950.1 HAMP domain-containing protein [Fulvimarina manganoxydans]
MNRFLSSIGGKLALSLAGLTLLTIVATIAIVVIFARAGETVNAFTAEQLSVSASSARFAEMGQAIRVDVPKLARATDAASRSRARQTLDALFERLGEPMSVLTRVTPDLQERVDTLVDRLKANIAELDKSVARRTLLSDQLSKAIARVNRLHADFLMEVEPLHADASFNIRSAIERSASDGSPAAVEREVAYGRALGRLDASANLAVGLMLRGASESDRLAIEAVQRGLSGALADASRDAQRLETIESALSLRQIWAEIARYGGRPNDLLDLRLRESGLGQKNDRLAAENNELLDQLGSIVASAVRQSVVRAGDAAGKSQQILDRGRLVAVSFAVLAVGLLVVFGATFIRSRLILRLTKVLSAMRAIAAGDLDQPVRIGGRDEIGQIAHAVRLFRRRSRRLLRQRDELTAANALLVNEMEQRRAAEDDLRRTQAELLHAGQLATLGKLMASLAHELNQPLAAMRSCCHNAARYLQRGEADQAAAKLNDIDRLAERMATTSQHLKNFARKPECDVMACDLDAVIAGALGLFDDRLRAEGVTVERSQPDGPVRVLSEPVRLERVFVNLISNALDAMEHQAAPRLRISVEPAAPFVVVLVADNGCGIADSVRAKLFEPFFTTKTVLDGLGLGLSISYKTVNDFGGRLEVESNESGGASARVELIQA